MSALKGYQTLFSIEAGYTTKPSILIYFHRQDYIRKMGASSKYSATYPQVVSD
jgi:hypothetical protein